MNACRRTARKRRILLATEQKARREMGFGHIKPGPREWNRLRAMWEKVVVFLQRATNRDLALQAQRLGLSLRSVQPLKGVARRRSESRRVLKRALRVESQA